MDVWYDFSLPSTLFLLQERKLNEYSLSLSLSLAYLCPMIKFGCTLTEIKWNKILIKKNQFQLIIVNDARKREKETDKYKVI
jgi:hypothetical protein